MNISVVVPVYNGANTIPALADEVGKTLSGIADEFELVLVNDGSPDQSWEVITNLAQKYPWVRGIDLMRNYGQHNATLCGIREATYEIIVVMDDDLQNPPGEIPKLIEKLYNSVADHSEQKIMKTFLSYDCLLIDEVGYVEVEPVQVGLFFTLMHTRHKKKTTMITSNLGFSQWASFLKNDQLTAALIDRLTENSHVINMKNCVSLRRKLDPVD